MAQRIQKKSIKTPEIAELDEAIQHEERSTVEYTVAEGMPEDRPNEPDATASTADTVPTQSLAPKRTKKRHWVRWTILSVVVLMLCAGGAYAYSLYSIIQNSISDSGSHLSAVEQIARIVDKNIEKLNGEEDDRINILLLGMGGENHPGGTLTDTVMVASIQPSTHKVVLVSIPRDVVVPIPPENLATAQYLKINSVLVHGDMEMEYKIIKMLTGLEIHYHVLMDFDGFTDVLDAVGGVTVDVSTAFQGYYGTDQLSTPCPANNVRQLEDGPYCIISFDAGSQHMNGERALMYSRIRKVPSSSNQKEAGDFARAERQQKVIEAFKGTVLNVGTLLNVSATSNLLSAVGKHLSTNMEIWEMLRMAELAKDVTSEHITNVVLDTDAATGVLSEERSTTTGAYYLQPTLGLTDYSAIQAMINNAIDPVAQVDKDDSTEHTPSQPSTTQPRIIIQNGSGITGLAGTAQKILENKGISDIEIGNALSRSLTTTRIYDLTQGQSGDTLTALESLFGVSSVPASLPTTSSVRLLTDLDPKIVDMSQIDETTDVVIVLGQDQRNIAQ